MSVGILLISHEGIGKALLDCARDALGRCPLRVELLSASRDCDPVALLEQAKTRLSAVDQGEGVLVLTDLYGSTPSNIAARLLARQHVRVVSGVNLPMLIRVLNYSQLDLDALTEKAVSGGMAGVMLVTAEA